MQKGWISIHRQIQDCWIWTDDDKFDKAHAWIDLLLLANHRDKKTAVDGKPVVITRGQFLTSILKLSNRWNWDRKTTTKFLNILENDGMIIQNKTHRWTTITIVNYEAYQDTTDNSMDKSMDNSLDNSTDKSMDTNNKVNNENNKNNISTNVDVQNVADKFNEICVSFPKVTKVSDKRAKAIKALLKEYSTEEIVKAFEKTEASDFMKGFVKDWKASFDWLMNKNNLLKVLEGNYDNKGGSNGRKDEQPTYTYGVGISI